MARKTPEDKMREEVRKMELDNLKEQNKQAKEYSKNLEKRKKALANEARSLNKLRGLAEDSEDAFEELEKRTEKFKKDVNKLNSDFQKFDKGFDRGTENFLDNNHKFLKGIEDSVAKQGKLWQEHNKLMEESAEEALKSLEKAAKDSVRSALGFSNSYEDFISNGLQRALGNTRDIQNRLIKETRSFNTSRSKLIKGMNASEMKLLLEQLQDSDRVLGDYLEDAENRLDESLKNQLLTQRAANKEMEREIQAAVNEWESASGSFAKSVSQACEEVRNAAESIAIAEILQSFSEQVDGFIENRRQILARVGEDFEVGRLSNVISTAMKDAHYTMSRNEMSEVAQEFIKTTRIQSLDTVSDYLSDISAMQKVYGTSIDNLSNIMWQDINSKADNQLFRGVSNIAASLENNANLYTSADSILEAINEKAGDLYGIARGDVKRQKDLMKSVSTIQAIQETAANKGVSALSEELANLQSVGTDIELRANEQFQQLRIVSGMSEKDLISAIRGGDIGSVYTSTHANMQNWTESTYAQEYFNSLFGGSAGAKAFAAQNGDELRELVENVNKSVTEGENANGILASDKAEKLTSVLDELKNRISDNFLVRGVADFFGELDISLANAAHAAIVASNFVKFFADLPGSLNMLKKAGETILTPLKGLLGNKGFGKLFLYNEKNLNVWKDANGKWRDVATGKFAKAPTFKNSLSGVSKSLGTTFTNGFSSLQTAFTNGISKLGGFLSTTAARVLGGVAGAVLTVKDAIGGWKKSEQWLGEKEGSTLSGKVSSAIGGAIGGTGPGIGQGSFGAVAKNMGGNALKGGAIGLAVGGPIGAGIGALLGAVAGAIGGERIAKFAKKAWDVISDQGRNVFGLMGKVVSDQWKLFKDTGNNIKKLWSDPKKGIFSKVGGTIKEVVTLPFKQLGTFLKSIKDWVVKFIKELPNRIFEPFIKLKKAITGIHDGIANFFSNLKNKVSDLRKNILEGIRNFPKKLKQGIEDFKKNLKENIHNLFSGGSGKSILKEVVGFLWEVSKLIYQVLWELAKALLKAIPKLIVGIITAPFKLIWKGVEGFFNGVRDRVTSILDTLSFGLTKLFGKFKEVKEDYNNYKENGGKFGIVGYGASKAAGWVKSKLGFADGLSKVPNDGLAYVHAGEAILTKAQAVMARADGGIDMGRVAAAGIGTALGGPLGGALGLGIFESIGLTKELAGKLFKGLLDSIKTDEADSEESSKFRKALRKFFGIGITGGDEGTSGSSGIGGIFGNILNKLTGGSGGSTTHTSSSGGTHSGTSGSTKSSTGTAASPSVSSVASGALASVRNQDLGVFSELSESEMNDWINSVAPSDSPFRNNGSMFIKASSESGLDPRYILAHAALESNWGRDSKAVKSNNYFGYGAFDSNVSNMYKYSYDSMEDGIVGIANKIASGYYDNGQKSLYTMRNNGNVHQYASDPNWDTKIAEIMATAPKNYAATAVTSSYDNVQSSGDWMQDARSWLGYKEEGDNDTPFGEALGAPGKAWCASFVSYILRNAGIGGLWSAGTMVLKSQAEKLGLFRPIDSGYIPAYGDVFIKTRQGGGHTGFVTSFDGTGFTTIEGNSNNMVREGYYPMSEGSLLGFISLGNGGSMDTSLINATDSTNMTAYAQGTPWVPEDQLALVHQGEMIVPSEFNPLNNTSGLSDISALISNITQGDSNKDVVDAVGLVVTVLGKKLDELIGLQSRGPYKKTVANSDSAYLMYNT